MSRGTRTRAATHAPNLAADTCCPRCGSSWVLQTISRNGQAAGAFWCGNCSWFFDREQP